MDWIKELKKRKIAVLYGGWSSEREVSLRSGKGVYEAIKRLGFENVELIDVKPDLPSVLVEKGIEFAVIMLHGSPGEDGTIQGLLETMGIPYTGSGVQASSIGIDKFFTKNLLRSLNIPVPEGFFVFKKDFEAGKVEIKKIEETLGYPVVVKPRKEGSSVGVYIAHNRDELERYLKEDIETFGDTLIERFIRGKSVTVGILGTGKEAFTVPPLELRVHGREFYDYKAKYTAGYTEFIIPAEIPEESDKKLSEYALEFYRFVGAKGFGRIDAMVDEKGKVYILELNTIPGMTELSDLPKEAAAMGIDYDEVVRFILKSGFEEP